MFNEDATKLIDNYRFFSYRNSCRYERIPRYPINGPSIIVHELQERNSVPGYRLEPLKYAVSSFQHSDVYNHEDNTSVIRWRRWRRRCIHVYNVFLMAVAEGCRTGWHIVHCSRCIYLAWTRLPLFLAMYRAESGGRARHKTSHHSWETKRDKGVGRERRKSARKSIKVKRKNTD